MPRNDKALTRRSFMKLLMKAGLAASGLLGLGALGRFLSFQVESNPPSSYDLGLASDYPTGTSKPAPGVAAFIIHNEQGFKALSLVCPHLGCSVNLTDEGFACPCHGSRFSGDGSLRNGPASHALTNLKVEVNTQGHLILYRT